LSEVPVLGRNAPYIVSFALFIIISIPTALVNNFAGLMVLRFLQGFFGSPCLANGGASMSDVFAELKVPYAMVVWMSAMYCGPALGPLLSGFSVVAESWRWSLWEILWMAAPIFLCCVLFLQETSESNILLRRVQRLRKLTGNDRLRSQSEIDHDKLHFKHIMMDALIKPVQITMDDPSVAFTNLYSSLMYGIFYSFFEVFPLVYPVEYNLNLGQTGLIFLCVLVGCLLGLVAYVTYIYLIYEPRPEMHTRERLEDRVIPSLFAVFGPPIGLFLFGWTAENAMAKNIPWIVPTIGVTIYAGTSFVIFQCIAFYVPGSYPAYAASLFAANDFSRSSVAAAAILFSRPMYVNLGIGKGVSVLGGLSIMGIIGMFVLYKFGKSLRSRSRFSG